VTGLVAFLLLAPAAPALAQRSEVLSPAYEAVVRRYASGDREGAVAEMSGWPDSRVRGEVPIFNREWQGSGGDATKHGVWRQISVRAALMLHSDCAQRARRDGKPPRPHESAAWSIAQTLKDDPAHRTFARRWYEAMAGLAAGENRWGAALDWGERGLRDFPDSVDMLLVLGAIEESIGAQATPGVTEEALLDASARDMRSRLRERLEKARGALRSAVAADPSRAEARLHLGRVAWRLGDAGEARSALEDVLARSPEAATAFLAHLFLGRLDEDAGRLDEAARSYEAALAIDPRCQSARLALSHVRLRLGDTAAARAEVETALTAGGHRLKDDAFWLYPWGPSVGVEDRLKALRREASSP